MKGIGKGESYLAQSVKVYFQEEHEDEIYDAICSRIGEHPEELEESFSDLHRMGELTLEEIKVMSVYTEWKSEDELQFEISTCATVDCDEGDHHYDDMRSTYKWYTVKGTGSLDNLLEDFSITNVVPYLKGKRHSARALKDTFVPDIKKENLDNVAEQILKKYYPEALKQPMPIDTDILLKRIGLSKIERRISKDASVFGRIYFEDAESAFYNDDTERLEIVPVKAGTIMVDPMVFFLRNMGSVNNTIIHECVHWLLHRPLFVLEKVSDSSLKQIDCAIAGGIRGRRWSAARTIEWQANALTPRIQMPARTFCKKADALIVKALNDYETDSLLDVIETVIEQLAEFFGVSKLSAKIRMIELGYEVARGAFIYIDGQYVRPYGFKAGFLQDNQTFSIGVKDFLRLSLQDYDLREDKRSLEYVYVDSHLVYDKPKYVHHTDNGVEMTPYALSHMDECCLVFDLELNSPIEEDRYHSICYLNRDEDNGLVFNLEFSAGLDNAGKISQDEAELRELNAAYDMLDELPGNYAKALAVLVDKSGMDKDEIADEMCVSTKTVNRILNGEAGSIENLAYFCLSLQLHPVLSEYLIERSPWNFDMRNREHRALREVLRHFYGHKMSYIRERISKLTA